MSSRRTLMSSAWAWVRMLGPARVFGDDEGAWQCRDMLRDDCPLAFTIDAEILMDDHISEPNYLPPGNLRVSFAQFRGYASARLAKQRQTVQHRALNDSVVEESISPADGKTGNQFDLFDGTEKAEPVRPHSKTASRITSDAMRGLSPRAETTSTLQSSTASRSSNKPVRSRSDRPGSKSTRESISEP